MIEEGTANRSEGARLDVSAVGFWTPGQRVFLDVRVFDLNAQRYRGLELQKCFKRNEMEKKKKYNERVLHIEHGTFTPLVFSTNGGMGDECAMFYKRLSALISEKRDVPYHEVSSFVRTKLSFSLLKAALLCVRGSRISSINVLDKSSENNVDIEVSNAVSHMPLLE